MTWRFWRKKTHSSSKAEHVEQSIDRTHNSRIFRQIAEIKQNFDSRKHPDILHFSDYGLILHCDKNDPYLWHLISHKVCPVHHTQTMRVYQHKDGYRVVCAERGCKREVLEFVELPAKNNSRRGAA